MSKLYYISNHIMEQAERMRDKIDFLIEDVEYESIFNPNKSYEEYESIIKHLEYHKLNLEKAFDNIIGNERIPKAEWKYIIILKNMLQKGIFLIVCFNTYYHIRRN